MRAAIAWPPRPITNRDADTMIHIAKRPPVGIHLAGDNEQAAELLHRGDNPDHDVPTVT